MLHIYFFKIPFTQGSLTCGEGGNLSTRDLGFIYVSSAGRHKYVRQMTVWITVA